MTDMGATTAMTTRTLVTSLLSDEGRLDAAEVYDIGAAVGFSYHQLRLCLSRLVQEGLFVQVGRGRKAVFTATIDGWRGLKAEPSLLALAFAQDVGDAPWDRRWHMVTFDFDEEQRAERNALRQFLRSGGGGALTKGVYVSPHDWDDFVADEAKRLGVVDRTIMSTATSLRVGDSREPVAVAGRIWPVDELRTQWDEFLAEHRATPGIIAREVRRQQQADSAVLTTVTALVVQVSAAFEAVMHHDPLLPVELLPRGWPGAKARNLILDVDEACAPLLVGDGPVALFRRYDDVLARARRRRQR
jgi:phenylacetic acid degradation operon negative regulatory protein